MKILYIITQADGGGAQRYVLAMAKHFGGAIAAGNEATELFEQAKVFGIKTFQLKHLKREINLWHDALAIQELYFLIKRQKPDIVHLNSTKAGLLGSIAGRLAGSKVVFTAHGFRFLEPLSRASRNFYLAVEKVASEFRDYIITVSEADEAATVKNRVIDSKKISTIHNGIPEHSFLAKQEARTKLSLPQDKFIFGTVANFYRTKGLDILIEAVAKTKPGSLFVIIGSGNPKLEQELKNIILHHNLTDRILLLGKIPNAQNFLKAFDAYALPSRKEGFPYAILDALQAGLPIVATEVGGIPEALGDAGLPVEPEDPEELAVKIEKISENPLLSKQLSQKALERSKLFTEERMFNETEAVYAKLLSK